MFTNNWAFSVIPKLQSWKRWSHLLIKTLLMSSYRNTSGSLEEREMLWEHDPQASVSTPFRVLPNFHECFCKSIETLTENMFSISYRKHRVGNEENNLLTLIIKMYILFARVIITSTARACFVFPSSFSIKLLAFYHECRSLIGYATHVLFCDR